MWLVLRQVMEDGDRVNLLWTAACAAPLVFLASGSPSCEAVHAVHGLSV
jgi:hypothetical protein